MEWYKDEERLWAVRVNHLLNWVILFGVGLFFSLIVCLRFRRKSKFVLFHALQAFNYQAIVLAAFFVFLLLKDSKPNSPSWNTAANALTIAGILWVLAIPLAVMGDFIISKGKRFHYPFVGELTEIMMYLFFR